ncbi:MAG: DNA primase, partial [Syntrophomonadaceae bacterium]|nr:DNA primase [Syntrophomonadaceae bacterium]
MTRYYNEDVVSEIQSRLDIVDIISETVNLTRKGSRYWGKCPFHQEKTASFCVTPEKNMFYCFGCNTGGDIFSFVMKRDNISFPEALEILALKAGIDRSKKVSSQEFNHKRKVLTINLETAKYYQQRLSNTSNKAIDYLAKRNISQEIAKKFHLGFADESWDSLVEYMLKKGYTAKDLEKAGLAKHSENTNRYFDLFRNRLIFPIFSYTGDIVGFGGRVLDDSNPKYLNSPETDIFSKRKNLYGLYQAKEAIRKNNQIILVEGYIDCIKLHQYGITNVVASLGTAFTNEQAQLIKKYAEEVIILYDGDEAGQRETAKVIDILSKEDIKIDVVTLPGSIDPDEYLDLYGKEDFLHFLKNNKISYIEFKLNRYLNSTNTLYIEDKAKIINYLKPDIIKLKSQIEQDYYIRLLAQKLKVEENIIYREFNQNINLKRPEGIKRNKKQIIRNNKHYGNYAFEEKLLAHMLKDDEIFNRVINANAIEFFNKPDVKKLAYIIKDYKNESDVSLDQIIREQNLDNTWARIML